MAYQTCVRATLDTKMSFRDNLVTGTMTIEGKSYSYRTRKHIAAATNKIYSDVPWKPQEGDEVIIDADIAGDTVIIDHIEPWSPSDFVRLERHGEMIGRIIDSLGTRVPMDKVLRHNAHDDHGTSIRIVRWVKPGKALIGRKAVPVIINAIIAEGEMRFCLRGVSGARPFDIGLVPILPHLCEVLGIPKAQFGQDIPETKSSGNLNKWRRDRAYRPEGMPSETVDEVKPQSRADPMSNDSLFGGKDENDPWDDFGDILGDDNRPADKKRKYEPGPVYDDCPF